MTAALCYYRDKMHSRLESMGEREREEEEEEEEGSGGRGGGREGVGSSDL